MSFWRHEEIYRSDVGLGEARNGNGCRRSPHSSGCDEFPVGYSSAGCSPAVPASASPPGNDSQQPMLPYNDFAASGNNPLNSVSQPKGALHAPFFAHLCRSPQQLAEAQALSAIATSDFTGCVLAH